MTPPASSPPAGFRAGGRSGVAADRDLVSRYRRVGHARAHGARPLGSRQRPGWPLQQIAVIDEDAQSAISYAIATLAQLYQFGEKIE
jgi:hypothetical protein